ncbi:hypothetical protein GALL_160330 [mine drainage metagenome]|uniref:Uncharacterized protein n=1 Tax=mine drainage metagenome TaxID=410659 RepID=A0A1J5S1K7_9ZZZZ
MECEAEPEVSLLEDPGAKGGVREVLALKLGYVRADSMPNLVGLYFPQQSNQAGCEMGYTELTGKQTAQRIKRAKIVAKILNSFNAHFGSFADQRSTL